MKAQMVFNKTQTAAEVGIIEADSATLWRTGSPVIIVLGTAGNTLAIVLLYRSRFPSTLHVFLMVLAVCDTLVLFIGLGHMWALAQFNINANIVYCRVYNWLIQSLGMLSVWLVATIIMQRAVYESYPTMSSRVNIRRETRDIIGALVIGIFVINAYPLIDLSVASGCCRFSETSQNEAMAALNWFNVVFYALLPSTIIVIGDCYLVQAINRNARLVASDPNAHTLYHSSLSDLSNELDEFSAQMDSASKPIELDHSRATVILANKQSEDDNFSQSAVVSQRQSNVETLHPAANHGLAPGTEPMVRRDSRDTSLMDSQNTCPGATLDLLVETADNVSLKTPALVSRKNAGESLQQTADTARKLSISRKKTVKHYQVSGMVTVQNRPLSRRVSQTTVSLITVTLLIVVLTLPYSCTIIRFQYDAEFRFNHDSYFWIEFTKLFWYANHALKFYMFFLTGSVFRAQLRELFTKICCYR